MNLTINQSIKTSEQGEAKHSSFITRKIVISKEYSVRKYIAKLNSCCSAGLDGITAEHLKYANNSILLLHLSILLSICVAFGIVPNQFCDGLLIPILKKTNIDPTQPRNYHTITVSSVLSKLLELHFLKKCDQYKFNSCQYGFISGRNTSMCSSVLHDVSTYCTAIGSSVYMCSLDAQGAFGAIPIPVLLHGTMNVLPDSCWQTLYYWYHNMSVQIRWANRLGKSIAVERGTKEGGFFQFFVQPAMKNWFPTSTQRNVVFP